MATQILKIVEGNTAPPITITCERSGVAINLTGCTADLIIVNPSGTQTNIGHTACTITSVTGGLISYVPQAGDFAVAGTYSCDVKITYGDTTVETLYDRLKIKARLKANSTV